MKLSQLKLFSQESQITPVLIVKISILLALTTGAIAPLSAVAFGKYKTLTPVQSEMLLAQGNIISMGTFVDVEHPTAGQVSIVEENGTRYLQLNDDFQTDEGPDLKVILHTSEQVGLKLKEEDYISLGALTAFNGSQRYAIPENIDLSQYQSVAIWCEQFNATFGYAALAANKDN